MKQPMVNGWQIKTPAYVIKQGLNDLGINKCLFHQHHFLVLNKVASG
jgi:hypothetical protein